MSYRVRTLESYNFSIKKLTTDGFPPEVMSEKSVSELLLILSVYPLKSRNVYISALRWLNKTTTKDETVERKLCKVSKYLNREIRREYGDNELSEREKKNYIEWSVVLSVYGALSSKSEKNDREWEDYVMLSLYVYHPPRRLDYQKMKLGGVLTDDQKSWKIGTNTSYDGKWLYSDKIEKDKKLEKDNHENDELNVYISDGPVSYFRFGDYKTYKYYGIQVIEVYEPLKVILDEYIKRNKKVDGSQLFDLSYSNYNRRLRVIFERYIGKSVTVNILRHSYASEVLRTEAISESGRRKIGLMMGHSSLMQLLYRKKHDPEVIELKEVRNVRNKNEK